MTANADPARIVAVDAFRGMTILAMILVNNPGDFGAVYWPLGHAEWHGCTPTFDVRGHRAWAQPFVVYGLNSILVFVGSGVLARTLAYVKIDGASVQSLIYQALFASWLPPHIASLGYAIAWVAGWYVVLAWLYRRGWFLKV